MNMTVIYDETGKIFYCATDDIVKPQGLPYITVEVPSGKILSGIDVSGETHEPIFEDMAKTDTEKLNTKIEELTNNLLDTQEALATIFENMEV